VNTFASKILIWRSVGEVVACLEPVFAKYIFRPIQAIFSGFLWLVASGSLVQFQVASRPIFFKNFELFE